MPPPFLSIKNFEKYQHYKQRNPPWIKLYYELLDDDDFISMSITSRHHYMTLLLIAGRKNNLITNDMKYLRKVMRLDIDPDLTELFDSGFLIASRKQSTSISKRHLKQNALSETETEYSETETDNSETDHVEVPKERSTTPKSAMIWESYRSAYRFRYGVDPVRNRSVNVGLCQVIDKLGSSDAPMVAAFYVTHNSQWYVTKGHPVNLLVVDAEKLRTEWATNTQVTATQARQADGKAARGQVWNKLIEEAEGKAQA